MKITPQCVVALTWTLKDTLGTELDVLDEPVEFLVGGNDLLVKVQEALQGYKAGDRLDLHLEPEDAFGDFNDQLLFLEPRSLFPNELEEGLTLEGNAMPAGCTPSMPKDARELLGDGSRGQADDGGAARRLGVGLEVGRGQHDAPH